MKKPLLFLGLILLILSCSKTETNTVITGTINGLKKGTLYLEKVEDTVLVALDSVIISGKSTFTFNTYLESPQMLYLFLKKTEGTEEYERMDIFAEPGIIQVQAGLKDFETNAVVTGSINHDKLVEYRRLTKRYSDKHLDIIKEKWEKEQTIENENLFEKQNLALVRSKYLVTLNFALNNKEYEIAPYLALSEIFDTNIKYLDTIYTSLTPDIQNSKYGKELQEFIKERRTSTENPAG